MQKLALLIIITISMFTGAIASPINPPPPAPKLNLGSPTIDDSDRISLQTLSPRTLKKIDNGEQLSVNDVKNMSKAGLSDETIINQIDHTKSIFYLSSADIVDLKKSSVSQRVINHMIQTGNH